MRRRNEYREYNLHGWTYRLNDIEMTASVIKGRIGRCKRFRLPEHVYADGKNYTINSVEIGAIKHHKTLKHLVVPDSYTYIDEDSFRFSPNLRSVYLGKGVKELNSWHFTACPKLSIINISKDNAYMKIIGNLILSRDGKRVLRTLRDADHYTIPDGVETINSMVFWCNEKLQNVTFPTSLRKIANDEFSCCENLKTIVFPEGLEKIGSQCFFYCTNLECVTLPSTIKKISFESFVCCSKLKSLIIKTPQVFRCESFEYDTSIPDECIIYVPSNLVESYKGDSFWKEYCSKPIV